MRIEKIFFNDSRKDGSKYIDKNGKPFTMANIYFDGQEKSASLLCYAGSKALEWKAGDDVDVVLEQNGQYLNCKIPNKTDELAQRLNTLENFVRKVVSLNNLKY